MLKCKRNSILLLLLLLFLSSCCSRKCGIDSMMHDHREKLREHFSRGNRESKCRRKRYGNVERDVEGTNISVLTDRALKIADRLKEIGRYDEADEFYSYVDVLMFGNKSVKSSMADVKKLVQGER